MRSAGCIINDIFDRNIDKKVDRTKLRPLASNQITLTNAITLLLILFIIGFYILTNLNIPSIMLGLVFSQLIILYPLAKIFFIFSVSFLSTASGFTIDKVFSKLLIIF